MNGNSKPVAGQAGPTEATVLKPAVEPRLRLFAFPHAGGTKDAYKDWPGDLPDDVELVAFTLPGRGHDRDAKPIDDWTRLGDDLLAIVQDKDDGVPFAFFGHSFGALMAFETCRRLTSAGCSLPTKLFVSAHRAPHVTSAHATRGPQSDDALRDLVRDWGLVPEELLGDDALLDLILPPLRADLRLDESYVFDARFRGLDAVAVACTVFGGTRDVGIDREGLDAWRVVVGESVPFKVTLFEGGHFFTLEHRAELIQHILDEVEGELSRLPSVILSDDNFEEDPTSIWERFSRHVSATPDAVALIEASKQWTYREVADATGGLVLRLREREGGRRLIVGLLLPPSVEYASALLATLAIGATACLLEKNWTTSLLGQFLTSAEVDVVVTTEALSARLPASFHTSDRMLIANAEDLAALGARRSLSDIVAEPLPSAIALISMTSGTSGTPKAVANSYRSLSYCFDARYALHPLTEASRDGLNAFFAWECLRPLLAGTSGVIIRDDDLLDPVRFAAAVAETAITRIVLPPSLFETVLDHPMAGPNLAHWWKHVEYIYLMGEVVPARTVRKAASILSSDTKLVNAYSTWESLDISYAKLLPVTDLANLSSNSVAVGQPLPGSAAAVLDDRNEPVARGRSGSLVFSSPGLALGYLNDAQKTAERFVDAPNAFVRTAFSNARFYRTGDKARLLPNGALTILGRSDDTVKIRGFKVSLKAVEAVLEHQEGLASVIVRPVLDESSGQPKELAAYLVGQSGMPTQTTMAKARRLAKIELPDYARPRHFIGLQALPISKDGSRKIDLKALPPVPSTPQDGADVGIDAGSQAIDHNVAEAWRAVLKVGSIRPDDNFFDLGADSIAAARLSGVLAERFGLTLPVIEVFQHSTLRAMSQRVRERGLRSREALHATVPAWSNQRTSDGTTRPAKLAVVGMAGRFPGADDVEAFWDILKAGVDTLTILPQALLKAKLPSSVFADPSWVPAAQIISHVDKFDASFWGIGRTEAEIMDPQHRVFIEIAWTALEQAGYARRNNPYRQRTGVFASCGIDGYLIHHLEGGGLKQPLDPGRLFLTEIGNEKDYIATRVAYLLDLGGPAITVTSACSSALVAIAQAAQAIRSGQCDMAIAGGASVTFPNLGYRYDEGLVGSSDGHVRPFDAGADGTLFGDGVGAVVLKRLDLAVEDGDPIWAVLSGVGISNDGRMKAGYTAPSAKAQAQCISDALTMAGISSDQISYVECHATATRIGDAIELAGLSQAFKQHRSGNVTPTRSCVLGSVKGNIGHANCAAGITGFIKAVLCLNHRELVPTVNIDELNPGLVDFIDVDEEPFTIMRSSGPWNVADEATQMPRRAGVSSFGIGGTNAHAIVEEAPEAITRKPQGFDERSLHLLTISAKSQTALLRNVRNWEQHLGSLTAPHIAADIRMLNVAREAFAHRACAVIGEKHDADWSALVAPCERGMPTIRTENGTVAFCFPGQGSQVPGMARCLYPGRADRGLFRRAFDDACSHLAAHLPDNPAQIILNADTQSLQRPLVTQCGLFAAEYALGISLIESGVRPVALAGHSIGEYTACVFAGVLELEEAAMLVAVRASACESMLKTEGMTGGMLGVVGDEARLLDWLDGTPDVWLAARNGSGRTVLSGHLAALAKAETVLTALDFTCRRVPVTHPFHSELMRGAADQIAVAARDIPRREPKLPLASNLSGGWFDGSMAPASYFAEHMVRTVDWSGNLTTLLRWSPTALLEVGPGSTLTTFAGRMLQQSDTGSTSALATLPNAKAEDVDQEACFLSAVGRLWCLGVEIDFDKFHEGGNGAGGRLIRRPAPTYSFDKTSYWVRPEASVHVENSEVPQIRKIPADQGGAKWLRTVRESPGAKARLYCLPFAGGEFESMQAFAASGPDWLDVVAIDLPGRVGGPTNAFSEDDEGDALFLEALAAEIRTDAGAQLVAFCGLSLGAMLVMDLLSGPLSGWARESRIGAVAIVGRAPAHETTANCDLQDLIVAPEALRTDPSWQDIVLPRLTRDLSFDARASRRVHAKRMASDHPFLQCPLQIHCGEDDPSFLPNVAADWVSETLSPVVEVRRHLGTHAFMLTEKKAIFGQIVDFIERLNPNIGEDVRPGRGPTAATLRWRPIGIVKSGDPGSAGACAWLDARSASHDETTSFLAASLRHAQDRAALIGLAETGEEPAIVCARTLDLLKSLCESGVQGRLELLLPQHALSGLVAGMTRCYVREEIGLQIRRTYADLPVPGSQTASLVEAVLDRIRPYEAETDILLRNGVVFCERATAEHTTDLPVGTLGASSGSFLITGGAGGIGRVVVDWLLHHQRVDAQRILVTGRREPPDLPRGVRYLAADLSQPEGVVEMLSRTGPLSGIFHLAGSLDDGLLRHLDAKRCAEVLAPKIALSGLLNVAKEYGAWTIAFSSTSGLFGAPGQSNYAAANAWMDARAQWPDWPSERLATIAWGSWKEVGMAARSEAAAKAAARSAETPFSPGVGLRMLGRVVASVLSGHAVPSRFAFYEIDWNTSPFRGHPLVSDVQSGAEAARVNSISDMHGETPDRPQVSSSNDSDDGLRAFLETYVHEWDDGVTLSQHGLDSLDFARMRGDFAKMFGRNVPLATFARPNQTLAGLEAALMAAKDARDDEEGEL